MEKPEKINKDYYHEALDRVYCIQLQIDMLLIQHKAIESSISILKKIEKAQKLLGDAYQDLGNK